MAETVRYSLQEGIHGEGGFGKVYKGHDNVLDRDVAVKTLEPILAVFPNERDRERFRREAQILARLSHPNIPAIYDVVFDETAFLIIFEFVEGKTLRSILSDGPANLTDVRMWFGQIASALHHAHKAGIIHRDIKPENIIIQPNRLNCYLVDFGIALSIDEAKRLTSGIIGTPGYMSPEQERGQEIDARSDIYALGVCLYESLSGHPIPTGQYDELSRLNEIIPPAIDKLVLECVARDKSRRVESAETFAKRLASAFATQAPLSSILSEGRLHEISSALSGLNPETFMQLPAGQRYLAVERILGVVDSSDTDLERAASDLLKDGVRLGIHLEAEEYRRVVKPAFYWGFEKVFGPNWHGNDYIRDALIKASSEISEANHKMITEEVINFLKKSPISEREDWFLHVIRRVLRALLANPVCTNGDAKKLAAVLREVNEIQTSRSSQQQLL